MPEETKVVEPDYEAYSAEADAKEISERLGTKPTEKKAEESQKQEPAKAVEQKKPTTGHMSHRQLRERVRELEAEIRGRKEAGESREEVEQVEEVKEPDKPTELRARPRAGDKDEKGEAKYKSYEEYEDDLLNWQQERTMRSLDERNTQKTQQQQIEATNKLIEQSWNERVEQAREAHEDFDDALESETSKLIQPGSIVDEWVLDSELGAEILYFFYKNPTELKKFEKIEGATPGSRRAKARRMLIEIEAKLDKTEQPKSAEERQEPRVTKAPPPVREIGGRGAQPTDRVRAAVANDDTGSYIEEMNRREIRERFGDRR